MPKNVKKRRTDLQAQVTSVDVNPTEIEELRSDQSPGVYRILPLYPDSEPTELTEHDSTFTFELPSEFPVGQSEVQLELPITQPIVPVDLEDSAYPDDTEPLHDDERDTNNTTDDEEWEETLIYVDLQDIPSVQELFAVRPDDFLMFQTKRQKDRPQPAKPTFRNLNIQFHNLDSSSPVLQIGDRYFSGTWEEPIGSSMFFQKCKPDSHPESTPGPSNKKQYPNLLCSKTPPEDPIFCDKSAYQSRYSHSYKLAAMGDKILKMSLRDAAKGSMFRLPATPGSSNIHLRLKNPRSLGLKELLSRKGMKQKQKHGRGERKRIPSNTPSFVDGPPPKFQHLDLEDEFEGSEMSPNNIGELISSVKSQQSSISDSASVDDIIGRTASFSLAPNS